MARLRVSRDRPLHDVTSRSDDGFRKPLVEERQPFVVETHEVRDRGVAGAAHVTPLHPTIPPAIAFPRMSTSFEPRISMTLLEL